ncbi:hypothetical protein SVAN01_04918 [Stagonosporopsis vannaccii]|nr:hypothetical protein SVAN01_04918 [Stagonosporopsis vannaccii]
MARAEDLIYIDVKQCCLVDQRDLPKDFAYVALSYVWGRDPQPVQTLLGNLADFKTPGAFDEAAHPDLLPKTIQDTLALVRTLGLDYAWIDRLCIVQDDTSDKARQLAAMASIYVNAYVTIVASDGDAQTGLAGTRKERPRQTPYKAFHLSSTCQLVDYDNTFERDAASLAYHTRGWTFQEWTLSRRLLIFHDNTVSWQCERRQSRENGGGLKSLTLWKSYPTNTSGGFVHNRNRPIWTRWPNIESYLFNVEEYARRALSYSEDTLNAIAAIIHVQGRNMKGKVLYGHPELFFTGTLLWLHVEPSQMLPDQVAIASQGNENFSTFPSWSWASRVRPLNMKLAIAATKYITRLDDGRSTSVYPSHFHTVSMYRARDGSDRASHHIIKDMHYWADSSRLHQMRTDVLPKNRAFNSYIPLLDSPETPTLLTDSLQANLIYFRTGKIFAQLTRDVADDGCMIGPHCIPQNHGPYLLDNLGRVIGHIYVSSQSIANRMIENKYIIELINIGGMEIDWNIWAWDNLHKSGGYLHRHCPKRVASMPKCLVDPSACSQGPDWRCRFYNVLWIERRNGIAYRKELGLVWADAWDNAGPEDVDIVLG